MILPFTDWHSQTSFFFLTSLRLCFLHCKVAVLFCSQRGVVRTESDSEKTCEGLGEAGKVCCTCEIHAHGASRLWASAPVAATFPCLNAAHTPDPVSVPLLWKPSWSLSMFTPFHWGHECAKEQEVIFIPCLPCTRHFSMCFVFITSFNTHSNTMRFEYYTTSFTLQS